MVSARFVPSPSARILLLLGLALLLSACGGGGGGDSGAGGGDNGAGGTDCPSGDTVECSLDALGVDTTATTREVRVDDTTMEELPEDYSPLGGAPTIDKFTEIYNLGFPLDSLALADANDNEFGLVEIRALSDNDFDTEVLYAADPNDTPWTDPAYGRAGAAADVDGDGREELVVVYRDTSLADTFVELVVIEDDVEGNTISTPVKIAQVEADYFDVAAADLDGDGDIEGAVALMLEDSATLMFLDNDGGSLGISPSSNSSIEFTRQENSFSGDFTLAVEAGNLDFDPQHEIAVIVNEYENFFGSFNNDGTARYAIYDDAGTDFAELDSGPVVIGTAGGAKGADIGVGDVDGDNVDEVILGGLTKIGEESDLDGQYIVTVLDDAPRAFATLRSVSRNYNPVSGAGESGASRQLTFMHVNAADVDNDGAAEIQANELIFEDLREDAGSSELTLAHEIPKEVLFWEASSSSDGTFSWRSSSMKVGDATSDKRDDIIYVSDGEGVSDMVRIWGLDPINGWSNIHSVPNGSIRDGDRPQVIPANVNDDSLALSYSDGSYRLVFTEPIIIAALAAAPCSEAFGQNLDDCRTAFGKGTSATTTVENGWSMTAGSSVGFESEFSVLGVKVGGVEAVASIQTETRKFTQDTYTLTKRVIHTTGPIEDSVIFTTTPLDVYTYEILSHPNPELIGGEVQVRLPREPVSIMADRDFYNATVDEESFKVDARIFEHTEGDPLSYPDVASRNSLQSQFENVQSDEIDVGQGTGFVTAEVNIFEEVTTGTSYSVSASIDVRATGGGVVTGYSIGGGVDSAISLGRGQESIYEGSVAQLPSSNFPDDAYRFGLFSYVYEDSGSGQEFEVVNYWVRPQL